jgi:predicted Zn-dependent protease
VDETERDLLLRQVYYHTGRLLYEAKEELGTAVDKLKRAAEEADDDPRLQYYLGQSLRTLVERENLKEAAEALRRYLEAGAPLGHEDEVREFLSSR